MRGQTVDKPIIFQFPPLREGRHDGDYNWRVKFLFQFPPLREGRLSLSRTVRVRCFYFNSRPCARGDGLG